MSIVEKVWICIVIFVHVASVVYVLARVWRRPPPPPPRS